MEILIKPRRHLRGPSLFPGLTPNLRSVTPVVRIRSGVHPSTTSVDHEMDLEPAFGICGFQAKHLPDVLPRVCNDRVAPLVAVVTEFFERLVASVS